MAGFAICYTVFVCVLLVAFIFYIVWCIGHSVGHRNATEAERKWTKERLEHLSACHKESCKSLESEFKCLHQKAVDLLKDNHDDELADMRQRCAEYVSERLRLDRSSGIEFPLTNIECGINQLPLRAERKDM